MIGALTRISNKLLRICGFRVNYLAHAQQGPDLHVYGSANLVQTLMKHDLVDEFWLKIYPLTLGSGKRLFVDGTIPAAFKVTESKVSPNGILLVNYERAGAVKTGSY